MLGYDPAALAACRGLPAVAAASSCPFAPAATLWCGSRPVGADTLPDDVAASLPAFALFAGLEDRGPDCFVWELNGHIPTVAGLETFAGRLLRCLAENNPSRRRAGAGDVAGGARGAGTRTELGPETPEADVAAALEAEFSFVSAAAAAAHAHAAHRTPCCHACCLNLRGECLPRLCVGGWRRVPAEALRRRV